MELSRFVYFVMFDQALNGPLRLVNCTVQSRCFTPIFLLLECCMRLGVGKGDVA